MTPLPATGLAVLGQLSYDDLLQYLVPMGTVLPYAGTSAPTGFVICDGRELSRTDYSNLFLWCGAQGIIGSNLPFGNGNGLTSFTVPDLRGKVPVGVDAGETEFVNIGKTGGEKTHLLTSAEAALRSHAHIWGSRGEAVAGPQRDANDAPVAGSYLVNEYGYRTGDQPMGAGFGSAALPLNAPAAHNNLQPYMSLNWILMATSLLLGGGAINPGGPIQH
jgi:microcystin-dependent protein